MTTDLLWARENVLPPAYRNETDWSCACQGGPCSPCQEGSHGQCDAKTGQWLNGWPQEETTITDSLGRPIADVGCRAVLPVWLADRACRFECPCACRKETDR